MNSVYINHALTFPRQLSHKGNVVGREVCTREVVNNPKEYLDKIKSYEGFYDLYVTVYAFASDLTLKVSEGKYKKPIIDTIFIDLDFDHEKDETLYDVYRDLSKIVEVLLELKTEPRVLFSGGKGFHVFIDFEPVKLYTPKRVITRFVKQLIEKQKITTLDWKVIGDIARISRMPNSKHMKSGLYCVPLLLSEISKTDDDLRTTQKALDHILKVSESKRNIPYRRSPSQEISDILRRIDKNLLKEPKSSRYVTYGGGVCGKREKCFRPCIREIYKRSKSVRHLLHEERLALCCEAILCGFEIDEIIDFYENMLDYDYETTKSQVEYAYEQEYYKSLRVSCELLAKWQICHPTKCSKAKDKILKFGGVLDEEGNVLKYPERKRGEKKKNVLEELKEEIGKQAKRFKFEKVGDTLDGIYLRSELGLYKTQVYVLEGENGEVYFNGSKDLDEKFGKIKTGTPVRVEFLSEEKLANGRKFKKFKVVLGSLEED